MVGNSGKEGNKIDLIETLEKYTTLVERKNVNKKVEVKKTEKKQDDNKENQRVKQGQNGKNVNSSSSNFSKFAVGNLKKGATNEGIKYNNNEEGKILKSKQMYVPVLQQLKTEGNVGNKKQENEDNIEKRNTVKAKSDINVKKIANRYEVLNNKELEGDMFMDEAFSDEDVDEVIEMETEILKNNVTPGAEKLSTKIIEVSQ